MRSSILEAPLKYQSPRYAMAITHGFIVAVEADGWSYTRV